jgi:hypothetical protein
VISFFKDPSSANVIWVIMLSIALHSHFLIYPPQVWFNEPNGLIATFFRQYIAGLDSRVIVFLYHFMVITQALRLNFIFNEQRMFSRSNFLTAMAYVLLTAVFREWNQLTPALVANTMIIWFFAKIIRLYNSPMPKSLLFNIGLVVGGAVLLYHPCALLVLVAIFALLVVRPFNIAELIVMLMGVLAPFYFLGVYLFITDQFTGLSRYVPFLHLHLPHVQPSALFFATAAVMVIILLTGLYYWQKQNVRLLIQAKKNWGVLMIMLFFLLPVPFINRNAGIESAVLWAVPASPFIAKGFLEPKKNTLPNIMFWALVILVILNNWRII